MKHLVIVYSLLTVLHFQAEAQQNSEQIKYLQTRVLVTIMEKCHLTALPAKQEIQISRDTIYIPLSFENEGLMSFWSPEVAVEYIFDAALYPLLYNLWGEKSSGFTNFQKIVFNVNIKPYDKPPTLMFEVSKKDWEVYMQNEDKVRLYKNLRVTASGVSFQFDPQKAVEVE